MSEPNAHDEGVEPVVTPETQGGAADAASHSTATAGGERSPMAEEAARKDGDPGETAGDTPDSAMAQI